MTSTRNDEVEPATALLPAEELDDSPAFGRNRLLALGAFALVCVVGIVVVLMTITDPRSPTDEGPDGAPAPVSAEDLAAIEAQPHLTVRTTDLGATFGRVAVVGLDGLTVGAVEGTDEAPLPVGGLSCDRVAESSGRGLCLIADRGALTTYRAVVFDAVDERELFSIALPGTPSRTRVSKDGRMGSATVFVSGHSYSEVGFSTATLVIDLETGEVVANLEDLQLVKDGVAIAPEDRNYWGVTFGDDPSTFYATVGTGGETYLVRGDLTERTMHTVRSGVECPSLSPDGTRVAFKQRTEGEFGRVEWRLAVLDLESGEVTLTGEDRPIDDQAEWLDDDTILYGLPRGDSSPTTDVWAVPADGSGEPQLVVSGGWSPTVGRAASSSAGGAVSG